MIKQLNIKILKIQHIKELNFNIDLSKNELFCITGKNGAGKTTLIRAIKNLTETDTFSTTASPYIFNNSSKIIYSIDSSSYLFIYNKKLNTIDTKEIIPPFVKTNIYVELPIPHGQRFNHFKKLADIDSDIRESITLENHTKPSELINFLSKVYNTSRFNNLKEIIFKKNKYYYLLQKNGFYIREDYFSSGEYFVISLYKLIQRKCKLIAIDEIDISLDASAQANLIDGLRNFCTNYEINIVFTTHSLPIMKTLKSPELHYLETNNSTSSLNPTSYNYIKSILFGFKGWDKYILTEDIMLKNYIEHLLYATNINYFYKYKIIYIGGAGNVVDLMKRNRSDAFFSTSENLICILDGDQRDTRLCRNHENVICIPFDSVEKYLKELYEETNSDIPRTPTSDTPKKLYDSLIKEEKITNTEIFDLINNRKKTEVEKLKNQLISFLDNA